ncbi:hypothetical protein LSTR_LSTR015553 [Laodelphax striatellus]|uniref:Uncharacterized protein n=1 Tax=Laodelphax striatellus TaxID=195883 RepID=A0A482WUA4_LAOST|nr:hypothetical protein LSTR_LSTR015553 [Laodelphax striatellus]
MTFPSRRCEPFGPPTFNWFPSLPPMVFSSSWAFPDRHPLPYSAVNLWTSARPTVPPFWKFFTLVKEREKHT